MAETGILGTVLGGVPLSGELREHGEGRGGGWPRGRCRAAARCARRDRHAKMPNGWRSGCGLPMPKPSGSSRSNRWWRVSPAAGDQAAHALLYRLGPQAFADRVLIAWSRSDAGAADGAWRELVDLPQRWTAPDFPLKAADFIRRGIAAGPALGAALRAAEEAWIAADFPADSAATRSDRRPGGARGRNVRLGLSLREARSRSERSRRRLPAATSMHARPHPRHDTAALAACARPAFHCRARRSRCRAAR